MPQHISPSAAAKSIGNRGENFGAYELLLLLVGMSITLIVGGYQFGLSNHTVYLIDPLRHNHPEILKNDWWATSTLQYHQAFTLVSAALMRWGVIWPVFFLCYMGLVALLHVGWWRLNRLLGGGGGTYLASVVFYYLPTAGFGLGLYRFLQDSAVLPSNLANIAMLWGIVFYATGRMGWAGVMLGLSGLFHLNHAVIAPVLWMMMLTSAGRFNWQIVPGTAAVIGLCLVGIAPVMGEVLGKSYQLPLSEFVDLYVRVRHAHHYEPTAWPWWFWAGFLWPIPPAVIAFWKIEDERGRRIVSIFVFFIAIQLVALVTAGFWFVSETLIQLSIYRFSIFVKLLACVGVGIFLAKFFGTKARRILLPVVIVPLLAVAIITRGRGVLLYVMPEDDAEYVAMCNWVRDPQNTPRDAVFIVPPQEQCFRLYAQRAIVVNLKGVPQLSSELAPWRERLDDVLDGDLKFVAKLRLDKILGGVRDRYENVSPAHLVEIAKRYGATYVIREGEISDPQWRLVHVEGRYRLYQLQ